MGFESPQLNPESERLARESVEKLLELIVDMLRDV